MKPGRELDALVAERVMGWPVFSTSAEIPRAFKLEPGEQFPVHPNGTFCFSVPYFSTDISAAWEVVEKLGHGWNIDKGNDIEFEVVVYYSSPEGQWKAVANTVPHAICLAALKAVGVEI